MFLAFMAFYDSFAACFFNKGVSHVSKCGISVHTAFKFHFNNGMLNHIKLILIEFKTVCNVWVSFNKFCSCKTGTDSDIFSMVFNQVRYSVNTAVYGTGTEVSFDWVYFLFGGSDNSIYKFINAFIFSGTYRDNRYSELL